MNPVTPLPEAEQRSERSATPRFNQLRKLRLAFAGLRGWRRHGAAFLLGAVAVAAMPPLHIWPALIVALAGLYWLSETAPRRRGGFAAGWWFGAGFFVFGLYWIANAFTVRGGLLVWAGPFAVVGLALLLACFPAAAALAVRCVRWRGIGGVIVFAVAWAVAEWLRGWVLTGFPWNLIATAWTFSDAMIQATAATGAYGLSLLTVAALAMPAAMGDPLVAPRHALAATALSFLLLAALWASGAARIELAGAADTVPGVQLRLIQPNIPQAEKWRRGALDEHLRAQLQLGQSPPVNGQQAGGQAGQQVLAPTHLLWAETAAPLFLADDPARLAAIGRFAPPDGLIILGTLRRTPPGEPLQVWNSLLAIGGNGGVAGVYDKSHLVPFGEYVPLRRFLGVVKLTAGGTDFSAGDGLTTMNLPGLPPFSPLICYEVIFPGEVVTPATRPQWLLNLTNDAWYGISAGPYQHFAAARLRAVEEGLPLVRVANSGISAIVDPLGRVVTSLGLGEAGVVDGPLPQSLASPTLYARFGNLSLLALLLAFTALAWGSRARI